jgi:hypothetical protein
LKINNGVTIEITDIKCINKLKSILIQATCEIIKGLEANMNYINFQVSPIVYHINISEIKVNKEKEKSVY